MKKAIKLQKSARIKTSAKLSMVYTIADPKKFKFEPDKFGGFGIFNKTGRVRKPGLEPFLEIVVIIEDGLEGKMKRPSIKEAAL